MERCTLCGGRLSGGVCTECGLDNRKNDKKYHLNIHNEKTVRFHRGDCDDNLNRRKAPRPKPTASGKSRRDAQERLKAKKRAERRDAVGTVRKKASPLRIVFAAAVICILAAAVNAVRGIVWHRAFGDLGAALPENIPGRNGAAFSNEDPVCPQAEDWDQDSEQYYETELSDGFYTVGYELPPGRYQFSCAQDYVWVEWKAEDGDGGGLELYSVEEQKSYRELWDEPCFYFERSEVITLDEGMELYVEGSGSVLLAGESQGAVRGHEPQNLPGPVAVGEALRVGEDLPAGVYDLVLNEVSEEVYASVYLDIQDEENYNQGYFGVTADRPVFWRIALKDGWTVTADRYGAEAEASLVPSY